MVSTRSPFEEIAEFADSLLLKNEANPNRPIFNGSSYSLRSYLSYISNYSRELSRNGKGISMIVTQTALSAMNPTLGMGQIFNPLSVLGPPPFAGGLTTTKLDVSPGDNPGQRIARNQDRLRRIYEGKDVDAGTLDSALNTLTRGPQQRNEDGLNRPQLNRKLNIGNPDKPLSENAYIDISSNDRGMMKIDEVTKQATGVDTYIPDYSKMFLRKEGGPNIFDGGNKGYDFNHPIGDLKSVRKLPALNSIDSFFSDTDHLSGYVYDDFDEGIEDKYYVPFSFQDLRATERAVYFRAFIDSINESFMPKWNKDTYYGRTDPVSTYEATERSIDISFKIAAMSEQGLSTMWKKINNFIKMLYPTKVNGSLRTGPIVRMKIGDLFKTKSGLGIPGYIESANFDYNPAQFPWALHTYNPSHSEEVGKVPMICTLSLKFSVVHDEDIYVSDEYIINSGFIRGIGSGGEIPSFQTFDFDEEEDNE